MSNFIFIGYDSREREAYDVAKFSIQRRASKAPMIFPLKLHALQQWLLTRPVEMRDGKMWCPISQAPMATEFAISRFCVPHLRSKGWALFVDCDIICLADINELFALADDKYAVMCAKHDYTPTGTTKMDGQPQTTYNRKNWSSIVLWNCAHPSNKKLTVEVLNTWPGRDLHAFKWLDDSEIGELPKEWNYLDGVYPFPNPDIKLAHLTNGGPFNKGWKGGQMDQMWLMERDAMIKSKGENAAK
jgi:lipopolysaccharide biosynthesis glycosyltransferase